MEFNKILSASAYLYTFKNKQDDPVVRELSAKYTAAAVEELRANLDRVITAYFRREGGGSFVGMTGRLQSVADDGTFVMSWGTMPSSKSYTKKVRDVVGIRTVTD